MTEIARPQQQRTLELLSALSYRSGELKHYLHEIAVGVSELTGVDWSVVTFCKDGAERILSSSIDLGAAADQVYSLHGNLTGTVVKTGSCLVVEDATTCRDYGEAPAGYRAYLGVPLRTPAGDVIGTICSFHRQPRTFNADEVQLVQLFAERAATAIDNYQLYQQQQQINAQLQTEIQERQEAEQALRESETRFRALVEQSVDAIYVIDPTGQFLDANPRALENLGYTREELRTLSAPDVQKRLPPGGFAAAWQRMVAGEIVVVDGIHQRKDGSTFPVEVRGGVVEWGKRQVALAIARDITERKQAEAKLRQSEEQLRQIAENLEQVFWISSADGQPIYISPAFEKVWRQPIANWYNDPDFRWKVIHPDDRDRVYDAYYHGCSSHFDEEYRMICPNGSVRIIRDQAFPIRDEAAQIYRIAGIAEDITERKRAEQEMLKAIASLAEVGELAAMIVHEIRNPLTTVLMGLNSFKRLELPAAQRERLLLSLEEAERLSNLLKEILLYAKPQTLQRSPLELNQFITESLEAIRTMPFALNRRIELRLSPHPVTILGDRDKLKQVFINLLGNACDAITEGETVTWVVTPDDVNHQVAVQVHNGGTPIAVEILPKLTKPFYTTKATGTGLGLAIVKRIVQSHDGDLIITSSPEAGTWVNVRLPLIPQDQG
ncbi:PAS domain S-box protein [Pantanalinema sp. GBBB05]|uniref:PAS domain S-box protein n=1 Tax=Pantanalinema sp. GBBB05 TaxID=2604139 RepID=UPI001DFAC0EF|nr:PAS domain S-box protein [Pantanalinema sp. GBBB05]